MFAFCRNSFGYLGLGDNININVPTLLMTDKTIRKIVCGDFHTLILKESGELFVFGDNGYGQLGLDDNDYRNVPTLLMIDKTIRKIVCGYYHTLILKESGELFVFGRNSDGQLGLDDNDDINVPTLLMINDNIISINGRSIKKIKWNSDKYHHLSKQKQLEIKIFILVCNYYKNNYKISVVKNMRLYY